MSALNPDRNEDNNTSAPYLTQLEQTNRELVQQVADYKQQLAQMQLELTEAERVLALNHHLELERSKKLVIAERELTELKSNFVLLASHEFRTPMMTILSSASLIGRYNDPTDGDKRERHVQRIKSAVGNLTTMLNDFLAISQVDQNSVHSQPYVLHIVPFCQDVITELQAVAKPRQRLHYEHTGSVTELTIDGQMLKNILHNLLANASKYSAEDTDIRLTSVIGKEGLTITVSDQGIGIPDSDKDKLFTNFFRARNAIHIQGTGLGLYLAKRYVELLGGSISFTSQVGQGTHFRIHLPMARIRP